MEKEGTKGQFYPAQQIQRKKISLKGEKLKKKKKEGEIIEEKEEKEANDKKKHTL